MRRLLDATVAGAVLLLLVPFLAIIAFVILVIDGRPVLFRQTRVGQGRVPFEILKFRTMTQMPQRPAFDPGAAHRLTRLGGWLRDSKVDEVPQLINVVAGHMSLVGPRPEVPEWIDVYPELFDQVLAVPPGITDPASLEFRDEGALLSASDDPHTLYRDVILPRKLAVNLEYLKVRTLRSDARVVMRTLLTVVRR